MRHGRVSSRSHPVSNLLNCCVQAAKRLRTENLDFATITACEQGSDKPDERYDCSSVDGALIEFG